MRPFKTQEQHLFQPRRSLQSRRPALRSLEELCTGSLERSYSLELFLLLDELGGRRGVTDGAREMRLARRSDRCTHDSARVVVIDIWGCTPGSNDGV